MQFLLWLCIPDLHRASTMSGSMCEYIYFDIIEQSSLLFYALIILSCPFMYCHFVQALDDDHLGNTESA